MLSFALTTGTNFASSLFHLPFDEEEDRDIESYERKHITWVADPTPGLASANHPDNATKPSTSMPMEAETTPSSSGSSSPCSLSASSSSASLSSMSSAGTSVSSGSATSVGHWAFKVGV
ncbi:hypothetical protein NMY22_g20064 [Coprinellus aureogranulatus]|nr:hypothetical protein NMY22_g20064 [Coprinellus aureogranulatus]